MVNMMITLLFKFIKKIIVASLLIYSFDVFMNYLSISIPINLFTVIFVTFFDFSALFCLFLFLLTF